MSRPLWLDHVTLQVPDAGEATEILWEQFGLRVTPTPGADRPHARVLLDRSYVELTTSAGTDAAELTLPRFFLGHSDVQAAMKMLRESGMTTADAITYEGVDGTWWDGPLDAPEGVPAPMLVQRIAPAALAADWPPPLAERHPSGVARLSAVYLVTPYVAQAVEYYEQLLTVLAPSPALGPLVERTQHGRGCRLAPADQMWEISLPGRGRIVVCDPLRAGRARDLLTAHGPGIAGLELATAHLPDTEARLSRGGVQYELAPDDTGATLWIDGSATPGIILAIRTGG